MKAEFGNYVTVYTDASFCAHTGAGGWACWVKYHQEGLEAALSKTYSGSFKSKPLNSGDAEIKAIINALVSVRKAVNLAGRVLVIVTDCEEAIRAFGYNPLYPVNPENKHHETMRGHFNKELPAGVLAVRINKVKAHSKHDGVRSYVNNLVDKLAKEAMMKSRKDDHGVVLQKPKKGSKRWKRI